MALSIFDLFTIGIGPSSSHTVGPMRAARFFANRVLARERSADVTRVSAELYGSLGLTGRGHGTGKAVLLGWLGERPDQCDPDSVPEKLAEAKNQSFLGRKHPLTSSSVTSSITVVRVCISANGMTLKTFYATQFRGRTYYSVGGSLSSTKTPLTAHKAREPSASLPLSHRQSSSRPLQTTGAADQRYHAGQRAQPSNARGVRPWVGRAMERHAEVRRARITYGG